MAPSWRAYSASYAGIKEAVDGTKCHHLKFVQNDHDWEMWSAVGEQPLVIRVVVDLKKLVRKQAAAPPGMEMQLVIRCSTWATNPQLPDERFKFTPPEGVRKEAAARARWVEGPDRLVGRPAPDFKLDRLEGGQERLSQHKGKEIVVLIFWTTYVGQCRPAMQIVADVARIYRDKGVIAYAVNPGLPAETLRSFLKAAELTVPVAVVEDGKVVEAYGAWVTPETVIVGKDGAVRAVHVGLAPDLKQKLTGELDSLLAGKDLAGQKPQP